MRYLPSKAIRVGCAVTLTALTSGLMLAPSGPAAAAPARPLPDRPATQRTVPAAMLNALSRDLRLPANQAAARMRGEFGAAGAEAVVKRHLGRSFGGSWIAPGSTALNVGITSAGQADWVRSIGARPVLVKRSEAQLRAVTSTLDKTVTRDARRAKGVTSWYADVVHNDVVVTATSAAAARSLAAAAGADAALVRVVVSPGKPQTTADLSGGDGILIEGHTCSVGFAVTGALAGSKAFLTAGHCGHAGSRATTTTDLTPIGVFVKSAFPAADYAVVSAEDNWTTTGMAHSLDGEVSVDGAQEMPTGSSVCRAGAEWFYDCGFIGARGVSVYFENIGRFVPNQTMTNICAKPGDSGGPAVSWNQGQGIVSAGIGTCGKAGASSYYQPLAVALAQSGMTLKTPARHGTSGIALYNAIVPGRCLTAKNIAVPAGVYGTIYNCTGDLFQSWTLNGNYEMRNLYGCLGTNSNANGTYVRVFGCNGSENQQWVPQEDGRIINVESGMCLDLWRHATTGGSPVAIAYCTGDYNQLWWSY